MQSSDLQTHPRVLLVEGPDDKNVVIQLSARGSLEHNFHIIEKGGKDPLLDSIEVEVVVPGRTVLGILLDADDDLESRWRAVAARLRQEEHLELGDLPDRPEPSGTIVEGRLRVGIWLMPDNRTGGELEDFVAGMIPADDPVWPRAEDYIDGIPALARKFAGRKTQRAKVHSWLAAREEPRLMGIAIKTGDLDAGVPNSTAFVNWLRRLFA